MSDDALVERLACDLDKYGIICSCPSDLCGRIKRHAEGCVTREKLRAAYAAGEEAMKVDVWHKAEGNPPSPVGDCRKIVWLRDKDGMEWCGIRAYNHAEMRWWINAVNGGREESAVVVAWQDLPVYIEAADQKGKP